MRTGDLTVLRRDAARRGAVALGLLLACACKTAAIPAPTPIAVPAGLGEGQVEIAILAAITGHSPAGLMRQANRPEGGGTEAVRQAALAKGATSGSGWYAELIEPGEIWARYYRGRHRLNVAVYYTRAQVKSEITGSEALSQEGGKIHKSAIEWWRDLDARIQTSLDAVAALPARG